MAKIDPWEDMRVVDVPASGGFAAPQADTQRRSGSLGGLGGFFQNPAVSDAIQAMGMSMLSSPSDNWMQNLGSNLTNLQNSRRVRGADDERRAKLAEMRSVAETYLTDKGLNPALAANPEIMRLALGEHQKEKAKTSAQAYNQYLSKEMPQRQTQPQTPPVVPPVGTGSLENTVTSHPMLLAPAPIESVDPKQFEAPAVPQQVAAQSTGSNRTQGVLDDLYKQQDWLLGKRKMTTNPTEINSIDGHLKAVETKIQRIGGASQKGKYSLNVTHGVDDDGNPIMMQASNMGGGRVLKVPNFTSIPPFEDARLKSAGRVAGKLGETARFKLPAVLQKADAGIALIDKMLNHPGRETATGLSSVFHPSNYIYGTEARNFKVMNKQLEGQAFLDAFEALKGGGHITEIEGQKATEARARLATEQSDEAYVEALNELQGILMLGKSRAMQQAGGQKRRRFNPATGKVE